MASGLDTKSFFLACLLICNPLLLTWHRYYVATVVYPLFHQKRATSYNVSLFEFVFICDLDGFLIVVNGFTACCYLMYMFPLWGLCKDRRFLRPNPIRTPHCLRKFVIAFTVTGVVSMFFTFVQFASHFLTPEPECQRIYHACDDMDVKTHLDSAESHLAKHAKHAKFINTASSERHSMRMDPTPRETTAEGISDTTRQPADGSSRALASAGSGSTFSIVSNPGDARGDNSDFVPTWQFICFDQGHNVGGMTSQAFGANDT